MNWNGGHLLHIPGTLCATSAPSPCWQMEAFHLSSAWSQGRKNVSGSLPEPPQKTRGRGSLNTLTVSLQGPRSNGTSQSWSGVHLEGTCPPACPVRL